MNVVTLTTCKRSLAILGQHNTKKKVGASTKSKFNSKLLAAMVSLKLKLCHTLYQCLKNIYSYKKVLLLLTTSPYKMSLHTLLSFLMFNNNILSLQKPSKTQTRWSYKMTWHLNFLQNEHFKIYNFAFWVPCYKMPWLGGSL